MLSAVDRILAGEFNKENRFLDFSTPRIELSVHSGEISEGSFTIYGPKNQLTEGRVSSSRLRMKCLTENFTGYEEEISYQFDAADLEEGECIKGEFSIISNQGEYTIPYEVNIVPVYMESSLGTIRNLFHFTNLAKTNFEEAVRLFYSAQFKAVFQGVDRQYYTIYRGLCAGERREQNVEEFLLAIKKKQKVQFLLEEPEIRIDSPKENTEYKVVINRNGWGCSDLSVTAEGDFLILEKDYIREEDFLGNCYRLPFYLAEDRLHGGRNYGIIHLKNAYTDLAVTVQVYTSSGTGRIPNLRLQKKHAILSLMQYYEAFRTRKISAASWMQETEKILETLTSADEKDYASRLMQVQLMVTQERYSEASWLLSKTEEAMAGSFDPALYCYDLYLTTLINREESYIDEVALQVERIYAQNPDNWRIAWLLLYLSEEYGKSPSAKWMVLEDQYKLGCISPVLYIEAYNLMNASPTLLMKLSGFELQVLTYALKKGLLNPQIAEQIVFLSFKEKQYQEQVYQLLKKCCELVPSDEPLRAVCTLLIKGSKMDEEAFEWYAKGIEKQLRITRLYEYYMMSVKLSDRTVLPKIVLMYFAFDSSLDNLHNAFLYAYVHKNKETYPEIYENYKEQIERFVVFQMMKGKNNKWLSYLYRNIVTESMITEETAGGLAEAVFIHRLQIRRADIHRVVIVYEKQKGEVAFKAGGREVYLPVYGSDCRIFLEDSSGCRYCREEDYELERMLIPDKLAKMAAVYITDDVNLDIWMCERGRVLAVINEENVQLMKRVCGYEVLEDNMRRDIRMNLIRYFYEKDKMQELDSFLSEITYEMADNSCYAEILSFFIMRGMYEKAYEWIRKRGGEGIDAKNLMRLCSRLIQMELADPDPVLTALVYLAFQSGKYDENLLKYLNSYYNGCVRNMRDVYKAAAAFGVDAYAISERILIQLLYTGAYISEKTEIFRYYVAGGAGTDVEMAFLSQSCYDYFVDDKITDDYLMKELQRIIDRREEVPLVCKLAYTRYYAENKELLDKHVMEDLIPYLRELIAADLLFPYYKEYADKISFMRQFMDKTMIRYRLENGGRAVIHYLLEGSDGEYVMQEMKEMFGGICVKQFILFFGEKLQYYITETEEGKEHLTESGTLSRSDTDREQKESKYSLINDIAIGRALDDENTMGDLLHEYFEREFMVEKLFHIV